jgi:hypothetical protein
VVISILILPPTSVSRSIRCPILHHSPSGVLFYWKDEGQSSLGLAQPSAQKALRRVRCDSSHFLRISSNQRNKNLTFCAGAFPRRRQEQTPQMRTPGRAWHIGMKFEATCARRQARPRHLPLGSLRSGAPTDVGHHKIKRRATNPSVTRHIHTRVVTTHHRSSQVATAPHRSIDPVRDVLRLGASPFPSSLGPLVRLGHHSKPDATEASSI